MATPTERVVIQGTPETGYTVVKDGTPLRSGLGLASARVYAGKLRKDLRMEIEGITERPCITCRTPFLSEGKHNRMCPICRRRSDPLGADHSFTATRDPRRGRS